MVEVVQVVVGGLFWCNCSPVGELQSAVWPQPLQSGLYQLHSLTVSASLHTEEIFQFHPQPSAGLHSWFVENITLCP